MPYMLVFMELILLLSQIALITQMYEWLTILTIITYQKDKSLGEILYKLNLHGIKTFRTIELINFVFYLLLVVAMVTLKCFGDYYWLLSPKYILNPGTKQFNLIEATDWLPALLLVVIFCVLVYQMNHYHNNEWKRLRKSIWVFFIVETSVVFYMIICDNLLTGNQFHLT